MVHQILHWVHHEKVGPTQTRDRGSSLCCHWLLQILYLLPWWGPKLQHMFQSLNMVHFHFPLNLRSQKLQNWIHVSYGTYVGCFSKAFLQSQLWAGM